MIRKRPSELTVSGMNAAIAMNSGIAGNRSHRIGYHLQHGVDPASVVSGESADHQRQNKGNENPDRAHRQGGIDGMESSGIDILTRAIGAKNVDFALIDSKQMSAEAHAEEFVFIPCREQDHIPAFFPC